MSRQSLLEPMQLQDVSKSSFPLPQVEDVSLLDACLMPKITFHVSHEPLRRWTPSAGMS